MSDNQEAGSGQEAGNGQEKAAKGNGQFNILAQYIKDLSFENPNAPESLKVQGKNPSMNVDVNVNGQKKGDDLYEVELVVDANGKSDEGTIYKLDLVYAGLFQLKGMPDQAIHQVMFINCPHLLFPYVRELVSHLTISSGFPPLFIDPIDFAGLYQQKVHQMQQAPEGENMNS